MKTIRPFGLWDSPLSPRSLAVDKRLSEAQWDSDGRTVVWLEGRSDRGVLVAQSASDQAPRDLTSDLSVRAEVGYGGGDFTVSRGQVFFVVHKTGRIYRQPLAGGSAAPITPPFGQAAAPVVSPDGRWVVYVHHDGHQEDCLAVVDAQGRGWPQILSQGHDFYMQPRFSPDGRQLAWIAWDHPNMPWDGTTLYLAELELLPHHLPTLSAPRKVAGGADTAIFQPEFSPDGRTLFYVSDETGWGRIVAHDLASEARRFLTPDGVEHGRPAWSQGLRSYAVAAGGKHLWAVRSQLGFERLVRIDLASGQNEVVAETAAFSEVAYPWAAPHDDRVLILASSPTTPARIVEYSATEQKSRVLARSSGETIPAAALGMCEAVSWQTTGGKTAHGLLYKPESQQFQGPVGAKPPLVVLIHGGPTSQVKAAWSAQAQFFATRGYAVLLVNYRGSTGYGRQYMLELRGNWGVCDVEDALSGKQYLVQQGLVDAQRTVIMGGSAGGFTVLEVMVHHPDAFTAGISLYGVANQFELAADTHKFESRYLDTMLGPLPEAAAVYRQRSPVFHAGNIHRPLAVFQGDIDRVVPREQSDSIVAALKRNGTPHVYHVYEGEGHGWRKTETIIHFYQAVDDFLKRYVLFA